MTTPENTHQPRVSRRLRGGAYQWVAVCGTHWERIAGDQAHALRLVALHNENPNSDGKR